MDYMMNLFIRQPRMHGKTYNLFGRLGCHRQIRFLSCMQPTIHGKVTDQWIKIAARENSSALESLIELIPAYRIGIIDKNRKIGIVRDLFPGI
ncbi:hypothetical protein BI380_24680 [Delftia tsuruhatensis]|uniref:CBS domain-containing protein n=1 Tax=Delftia tsuruhatensis TaxID=180282 RepID=A0ABN4SQN1_9BURK|nr:hypothetical protein BI380_24680 [Delftia tsuruhatensis]